MRSQTHTIAQDFRLPPLPFDPDSTEPVISKQANVFHHDSVSVLLGVCTAYNIPATY